MAIVFQNGLLNPLSLDVAGPSVLFLIAAVPFYSFILFMYEKKLFSCRCILRRCNRRVRTDLGMRQPEEDFRKHVSDVGVDEDIIEEETRVEQADPRALTVMVDRV